MSIETSTNSGFVNTELRKHDGELMCFFWLADETGRTSATTVIMNAGCCRNVAETLFERARELEAQDQPGRDGSER